VKASAKLVAQIGDLIGHYRIGTGFATDHPICRRRYLSLACPHRSGAMADLAHDASGPASSEPADIAVKEAGRAASSHKGKLRVFISYSRHDLNFADQLDAALNLCGFECLIDRHDISGGEEWKRTPRQPNQRS
jgi:TIR domain-containing protein